jgi:Arc/MetJ-type ribon-helix-helix transcriptional regulator
VSTVKVTITLGSGELVEVRRLVELGQAASVSAFVQNAVRSSLQDVAGWAGMLAEALEGTGGPLTPEEIAWADEALAGGGQRADSFLGPGSSEGGEPDPPGVARGAA